MSKYLAFAKLGFRQALAEPGELLGRALFFVLILGVFSSVWRAVAESGGVAGRQPAEMLWYLAVTEWVLMSAPLVQFQMEEDIRRGDVAYEITRPASWLGARLAHGLGALAVRAPVLLVVAFAAAWSIAGPPTRPAGLGVAIAIGLVASMVVTLFHVGIGVAAFWLGDVAPAYWIWQKLLFVLGGMLIPLTLYPEPVRFVARASPFAAMLFVPGSLALDADAALLPLVAEQLSWLVALALMVVLVDRAALARLLARGS